MVHIPTDEEVWQVFETLLAGRKFSETRKLTDGLGVYLWDIKTQAPDGSALEYLYMRKGQYPEGFAYESRVDYVYLNSQGEAIGGASAARFIGGKWTFF